MSDPFTVQDRCWAAAHALRGAADTLEENPQADPARFLRELADQLCPQEPA